VVPKRRRPIEPPPWQPELFTTRDNAERPAEPMYRVDKFGEDFGLPCCVFDYEQQKLVLNPEYGGAQSGGRWTFPAKFRETP
jgi:hypothetical protein